MITKLTKEQEARFPEFIMKWTAIRRLESMPKGEHKQLAKGRCILAHGESGNIHMIDVSETDAELIQIGERILLNLKVATPVKHEEH